jgi:hypothetical protein
MDETLRASLQEIASEADDLMDEVEQALDEHASFSLMLATRVKVETVSKRYRESVSHLEEKDRFQADRTTGRKVADLQKAATRLPNAPAGKPAEKRVDTGFFETRAPTSSRPPITLGLAPGEKPRSSKTTSVADEIDAWCGRCLSIRSHVVAAMVGDQPAQVVCQSCGSRSRFREGPARTVKKAERKASTVASTPSAGDREREVRAKEKRELQSSLQAAENVRAFSPKERYKAGEIIEHPEHGRGKIENTLPRSLLVRFTTGLKPLKLS